MNNMSSVFNIALEDFKSFILGFKFDNLKIFLIGLFCLLYLPHCFILNEDLGLLTAYNNDSGSISEAIIGLLNDYNFHDHLHIRFYGWTYFVINYILLKPVDLFLGIFQFNNSNQIMLFSIKLVFFLISLLSLLAFNELLLKIFKNNRFYAFLGSALYALSGSVGYIFYNIHPETTGLLFLFLAILSLLNFIEKQSYKYYIYGLIFLILSSLSKQIFFFTSLPILLSFIIIIKNEVGSFKKFIASKKFIDLATHTLLITFLVTLVINPFLIFNFERMLGYQIDLIRHHKYATDYNPLSTRDLFIGWMILIGSIPIMCFYFASVIFVYIATIYSISKKSTKQNLLFLNMIISIYVIFALIFSGNNLYIMPIYMSPIYPFCIIYFLVLIKYLKDIRIKNLKIVQNIAYFTTLILYFVILLQSMHHSITSSYGAVIEYKKSLAYKSYEYILENFNENDNIIYGPFVGMPSNMNKNNCSYWFHRQCLSKIDPEYIMLIKDFSTNGGMFSELKEINIYIKKNNLKLIDEIIDERRNFNFKVSVYKNLNSKKTNK